MHFGSERKVTIVMMMCVLFTVDAKRKKQPIDFVIITEKAYRMPTPAIIEAFNYVRSSIKLKVSSVKEVIVEEKDTEETVCRKIFDKGYDPTIMIDTTRRPRTTYSKTSFLVKRVARKMGVPTIGISYSRGLENIAGWEELDANEREYLIWISPPGDIIPVAIRSICMLQKFKSAGILYDKELIMDRKYVTLLGDIPTQHLFQEVEDNYDDVKQKILNMKPPEISNFFVLGSVNIIEHVLRAAEELKLYGRQFAWFFITKDSTVPTCNCTNITALFLSPKVENAARLAYILKKVNMTHDSEIDVALNFDMGEVGIKVVKGLMIEKQWPNTLNYSKCENMSLTSEMEKQRSDLTLLTSLKSLELQGTFGKFVFRDEYSFQQIKLNMKVLQFVKGENGSRHGEEIGTWLYDGYQGKFTYHQGKSLSEFKADNIYRVTTVTQAPFIYKTNNSGEIVFTGYCIDMLNLLKDAMGFEYTISETKDGKFGAVNDKGEWNGMIRDLIDRKADIALGPISVMTERETVVDFTIPYYELVGISILMKKAKIESSLFKFLTVLENEVWGCILAAYFFTSFLMYLFDRLSPYSFHNNREELKDEDENRDFTAKECLWFCMTSLTPQGGGEAPRNLSGRLTAATWWLFGFIVIASYTANLAAFLTVARLESTVESLDDLTKQHNVGYAPQKDTSSMAYFERMAHIEDKFYEIWKDMSLDDNLSETDRANFAVWDYPVSDKYTKIWRAIKDNDMPNSLEEGIQRVRNSTSAGGFALIADSTQVRYALLTSCDFVSVGKEFSQKPLALAVQKRSPLKDELSSAIHKLLNGRELEQLKVKWWNKNPENVHCDDRNKDTDGISIANIGGVFIVIFSGIVLSCLTLFIEYWYYGHKKASTQIVVMKDYNNDT